MRIQLLGEVQVWAGAQEIEIGPPQRRTVLAAMAVDAGRTVPLDVLIDRVWGARPPAAVGAAVHSHVTGLRRLLKAGSSGAAPEQPPATLRRQPGGYVLQIDRDQVDVHRFHDWTVAARDRDQSDAARARLLRSALDLWHGQALAGLSGEWPDRLRVAWHQHRLDAAVEWARALQRLGQDVQLITDVRRLTEEYPLSEPLAAALIGALAATGREAEALEHYAAVRTVLADRLGADPGAELQQLHQAILRGHRRAAAPTVQQSAAAAPAELPRDLHGFVGRVGSLRRLTTIMADGAGRPAGTIICAVSGMAGVGKTTLAIHWAHHARHRFPDGQLYVNLRGFDPHGPAVLPVDALGRFLQALAVPADRLPATLDARAALYRTRLAGRRMLVILDNALDTDQVRPLLPGTHTCPVVITSRNQLTGLVAGDGAYSLTLDVLPDHEAHALLRGRLGADRVSAEPAAVAAIVATCGRLPLALAIAAAHAALRPQHPLAELARELHDLHNRLDVLSSDTSAVDVRAVFSWSYQALGDDAARLLGLLSLHPGPDIGEPAAASLSGQEPSLLRPVLAELVGAHLIMAPTTGRYVLHDLVRAFAAEKLNDSVDDDQQRLAVRRVLDHYLHSAVAADRLLYPHRDPIACVEPDTAVTPERLSAAPEALTWFKTEYQVLLAAIDASVPWQFHTHTWQLAWALSTFINRQISTDESLEVLRTGLAATEQLNDPGAQAILRRILGMALLRLQRLDEAAAELQQALAIHRDLADGVAEAQVLLNLVYTYELLHRYQTALEHAELALSLFSRTNHQAGYADALNWVGWCHALLGNYAQTVVYCRRAIPLQQQIGDRSGEAATWDSLGYAHYNLGDHEQAVDGYQRALDIYRGTGDRYAEADSATHLGDAHAASGDLTAAHSAWQHAFAILNDLNHPDAAVLRSRLDDAMGGDLSFPLPGTQ
jgi:DNA-binding SARP family transcriptional activator/Tfp pilus assembly protein PilF